MSLTIRRGRRSCFSNRPENTNLVEDIEILLPVKFRWIPFSGFREVKNVSANRRPGRPFYFSDRQKNTPTNLVEDAEILFPVKFCWIPFSGFREVKSVSAKLRPGRPFYFTIGKKPTNLVKDVEIRGKGGHLVFPTFLFYLLLKNFNLGCYLMMVAARRASLSSDNSYLFTELVPNLWTLSNEFGCVSKEYDRFLR